MLCIKNGMVHDAIHKEPYLADILVEDGKIAAIGERLEMGTGEGIRIVDAEGLHVYPGFVEAHGHIGLDGYGIGYEGMDYNELNDIISPQMRGIDGVKPMDAAFSHAAAAGVTCVCVGPGSANVLGGTFTVIKTVGKRVDDMVVRDGVAMKCAFGENPKRVYREKKDSSRMTTAALLRETLFKAKEYMEKKEAAGDDRTKLPAFDMKMEALLPVMKGQIPLKAHAHATEDIFTALRIAKEFGLKIGACDGRASDCGGTGKGKRTFGGGTDSDQCIQVRAAQQKLDYARSFGKGGLSGIHHYGFPGDSPGIPSSLCGAGGAGGDGSFCGIAGNYHPSGKTRRRRRPGRFAGSGEGCGLGDYGRMPV